MILHIYSENPHLLDIINKNPETDNGLYLKPLKDGVAIGNAVSVHQYDIYFQDGGHSYTEEIGNQLDYQSLCNPLIVLHLSTDFLGHILKESSEYLAQELKWLGKTRGEVDPSTCKITVPNFYIYSSWYRDGAFLLSKYFKEIKVRNKVGNNFELAIEGKTVFQAVNMLNLVALFAQLTNEKGLFTYIDDSFASKYVRVLTNIEGVPYFVLYLFIKRAVKNKTQFEMVKPLLENYLAKYGIVANLTNEDTQLSRIGFITEAIGIDLPVLDIGCGEFAYYKRLMNRGLEQEYFAVDKEIHLERLGQNIMDRLDADNLKFSTDLTKVPKDKKLNIIISEVIEHNTPEDALALVKKALTFNFEKIVISTPNADFNQFYFDNGFRHSDHHFEFTQTEFKDFIASCTAFRLDLDIRFDQVGDELNGLKPTQIVVIEKNKNHEN
ncbi:methyltransferase domain-containing protein [Rhizosphaericola mali]|uniref:Small RNA 2'-O-methyltransferase n=1 Tax=Rhizosphaericola mali TaxID=2545455 RepID=A0A5P2G602_9BACT|nr:hypothetical protein [Rhizosphaericola mali]QES90707.1 hypothetical protein E0W69_019300 [Rhizosphaericola mali]